MQARQGRTQPGRRAQKAEPGWSHVQDVARVSGQQRSRTAEQHCEQVERDRTEDHRARAHEAQALEHRVPRRRLVLRTTCGIRTIAMSTTETSRITATVL